MFTLHIGFMMITNVYIAYRNCQRKGLYSQRLSKVFWDIVLKSVARKVSIECQEKLVRSQESFGEGVRYCTLCIIGIDAAYPLALVN
jgi:hypothetical protein